MTRVHALVPPDGAAHCFRRQTIKPISPSAARTKLEGSGSAGPALFPDELSTADSNDSDQVHNPNPLFLAFATVDDPLAIGGPVGLAILAGLAGDHRWRFG